jgi:hypothetical protein
VGGTSGEVLLTPSGRLLLTLPAAHGQISCTVEAPRFLFGGFGKDELKGRLVYRMGDTVLGEIPLATADAVSAVKADQNLWDRIKKLF